MLKSANYITVHSAKLIKKYQKYLSYSTLKITVTSESSLQSAITEQLDCSQVPRMIQLSGDLLCEYHHGKCSLDQSDVFSAGTQRWRITPHSEPGYSLGKNGTLPFTQYLQVSVGIHTLYAHINIFWIHQNNCNIFILLVKVNIAVNQR